MPEQKVIDMELHSGLVAQTQLLLGNEIKEIRSLYLMNSPAPTLSLNEKAVIINSEILSVPKEIFVNETYEVRFSNGYILECSPGTPIMGANSKWVSVKDLRIDDKILGAMYTEDRGIVGRVFAVDSIRKNTKIVGVPTYFFASQMGNILLPHATDDELTFICISQ